PSTARTELVPSSPAAALTCAAVRCCAPETWTFLIAMAGPHNTHANNAHSIKPAPPTIARLTQWTSGSLRAFSERVQSWPFSGSLESMLLRQSKRGNFDRLLLNRTLLISNRRRAHLVLTARNGVVDQAPAHLTEG